MVGHAKAITPLIPVPLEGPAILRQPRRRSVPLLIIVLQGYGVTVDLVGATFINEKPGVTSSNVQDGPRRPRRQLRTDTPRGKYSALAANANLCKAKLAMPTEFVAQNGAEIHQRTKISVTGCPKAKHAKKAKKSSKHRGKAGSRSREKRH